MTKRDDKISLTELATKLDVSPAWIKKIEEYLGLKWGSGERGRRSCYDSYQTAFFVRVLMLRNLGFNLPEIRLLYDKETEIQQFINKHFGPEKGKSSVGHITIYLTGKVGEFSIQYDYAKYSAYKKEKRPEAEELNRLIIEYCEMVKKFLDWIHSNFESIQRAVRVFEEIIKLKTTVVTLMPSK